MYGYDGAGNRTEVNATDNPELKATATVNNLNQITKRPNLYIPVSGTADADAKVLVNGAIADRQGNYWASGVTLNNNDGPAYTSSIAVKAAKAGTVEIPSLLAAFLPWVAEGITYDADGNVTCDGRWHYTWDAENRLTAMETRTVAMNVGLPGRRVTFRYDSSGRRTVKQVLKWSGSTWSLESDVRFIYQGWNLIAELNSSGTRQRTYAWGLDKAGSLTATGGVGALLQEVDHTGTAVTAYLPGYDGNGNVATLSAVGSTQSATYEYSPYGESLRAEGAQAKNNPFRFSTKYTDDETGLVYYGMRYYSPSLGRFLGRDPSGEQGGMNLYRFCNNNPVNGIDLLGMLTVEEYSAQLTAMSPEERGWAVAASVWWAENGQGGAGGTQIGGPGVSDQQLNGMAETFAQQSMAAASLGVAKAEARKYLESAAKNGLIYLDGNEVKALTPGAAAAFATLTNGVTYNGHEIVTDTYVKMAPATATLAAAARSAAQVQAEAAPNSGMSIASEGGVAVAGTRGGVSGANGQASYGDFTSADAAGGVMSVLAKRMTNADPQHLEYSGAIFSYVRDEVTYYGFTTPVRGGVPYVQDGKTVTPGASISYSVPGGTVFVGGYHSHPSANSFSNYTIAGRAYGDVAQVISASNDFQRPILLYVGRTATGGSGITVEVLSGVRTDQGWSTTQRTIGTYP
ncbi:hypothetical protein K0B96_02615 [Horticoccus luteus]|uniref:RHS repeat-associated protein n=1 Tax=Horticoccus luteus TaxID=2862869 RepID=A0A8F9TWD8_9BACT|nr:RHS repeat-associated core domain-containing protein [Horticoccus luteus]QYM79528.1 hypothetical protein K0B96_02615 [Horticoccus luteus]